MKKFDGFLFETFCLSLTRKILFFSFHVRAPAHSPDLNPIELVWGDGKRFAGSEMCETLAEVRVAIGKYRSLITPEKCSNFKSTLREVIRILYFKILNCKNLIIKINSRP
jgi:hypothetical protein